MTDFLNTQTDLIIHNMPIVYSVIGGFAVRVLLITDEPMRHRLQNSIAGALLGLLLSGATADLLTAGKYQAIYAVLFSVVGRELVIALNQVALKQFKAILTALFAIVGNRLTTPPDPAPAVTKDSDSNSKDKS